jgi:uncharacterized protein (DUF488 family)
VIPARGIWSIGHSNHAMARFLELLRQVEVEVVADVRSQPFSRFSPHFRRHELESQLAESGLSYVFLGEELGGRPREPELYDAEGHVLYGEVARTARFRGGLRRLVEEAASHTVAMLCAEEDPTGCHRRLLVARVLGEEGVSVTHVRGDGSTVAESDLAAGLSGPVQSPLFGGQPTSWRSVRPVARGPAPRRPSRS